MHVNFNFSGITNLTGRTSNDPNNTNGMNYDSGVRKLVAVDLNKLDRVLHRDVLGARGLPPSVGNPSSTGTLAINEVDCVVRETSSVFFGESYLARSDSNHHLFIRRAGGKGPPGTVGTVPRTVKSKHLVASLAVALAAVFADSSESFGRKFTAPVEESFTFTTDTKVK